MILHEFFSKMLDNAEESSFFITKNNDIKGIIMDIEEIKTLLTNWRRLIL